MELGSTFWIGIGGAYVNAIIFSLLQKKYGKYVRGNTQLILNATLVIQVVQVVFLIVMELAVGIDIFPNETPKDLIKSYTINKIVTSVVIFCCSLLMLLFGLFASFLYQANTMINY